MPQDQRTFLEDPYGYATGGLPYRTITGKVAMACKNATEGAAYGHTIMDLASEIPQQLQWHTSSHNVLLIPMSILRRRRVINNGIPM